MDLLVKNAGLSHISKKILQGLNFQSLSSCRLVCKSMNDSIKEWASKVTIEYLKKLFDKFTKTRAMTVPKKELWKLFFNHLFSHSNLGSEPNIFMNLYLKHVFTRQIRYKPIRVNNFKKSPIFEFVCFGNARMVQYILVSEFYK